MDKILMKQAITKYIAGLIMVMLLLFVPAGTLRYWNGWLFIALLFVPMLFLSIPLVLGSWVGFVIFLLYPFLLVKRIRNEEEVLEKGLKGYGAYKEKVKYRMLPFIW